MNNKSLFEACAAQCAWCAEQWPVVLHSGDAAAIRKGFKYADFKGGKQIRWRPPSTDEITARLAGRGKSKFGKNLDSPKNRQFWRGGCEAVIEVASWPDWKRGGGAESSTPERLGEVRRELAFYDAMDWWTRQPCSDNLRYRPHIEEGVIVRPTCNGGLGCATCWERYERYDDEHSKDWD